MKYAICYNKDIKNSEQSLEALTNILTWKNIQPDIFEISDMKSGYDFVFVIGGDGTILKAARFYTKTPVFGINLGRLGFLSQTSKDNLKDAVDKIIQEDYRIEKRLMLKCGNYIALNDFVVKTLQNGRLSKFCLKINDKFVCEYKADGIIISTPTGSTAYCMAAGGTILCPNLELIEIIPICPHSLSARPIVVSGEDKITIIPESYKNCIVTADGQENFYPDEEIKIEKSDNHALLAALNDFDFYSILRNKLQWGILPTDNK